jgi:hypothetical protein
MRVRQVPSLRDLFHPFDPYPGLPSWAFTCGRLAAGFWQISRHRALENAVLTHLLTRVIQKSRSHPKHGELSSQNPQPHSFCA